MKISYKWLKDFVNLDDVNPYQLQELLTNAGLEIEEVYPLARGSNLTIGKVIECKAHPDSDHLQITKVDIKDEILDIVCGAKNCRAGIKTIVAKVGAKLPNGEIKSSKVRGVISNGMLCSLRELGVDHKRLTEEQIGGIEILADDAPLGIDNVFEYLGLDDVILDAKPTPNRPDLLSVFGVAKEVGAVLRREVKLPDYRHKADIGVKTSFNLQSKTDKCKLFNGKVVNHVEVFETPAFMRERLINSGIHSLNNVIDISNYVMLELGQPLHFYDLDKISSHSIAVEEGRDEVFTTLDNQEYKIEKEDLVITENGKVVGIAGVMGGDNSKIDENTKGIFIEAAIFDGASIRNTARRLNLITEASVRFSKGIEALNPFKAVDRAVELLTTYANASGFEENISLGNKAPEISEVCESLTHMNMLLGTDYQAHEVLPIFEYLDFNPKFENDIFTLQIPSFRQDIKIAQDIDEEVIRLMGFDRLKTKDADGLETYGSLTSEQSLIRKTKDILVGFGLEEVITYTLIDEELKNDEILADSANYELLSPMSEKRRYLRESMMGSILECGSYNRARKVKNINIFEFSKFSNQNGNYSKLGLYLSGNLNESRLLNYHLESNFYTFKGMIIEYLGRLGIKEKRLHFEINDLDTEHFYPHKSAKCLIDGKVFGLFGYIHPNVLNKYNLEESLYGEFLMDTVFEVAKEKVAFKALDRFPSSIRDLAIVVKEDILAKDIIKTIKNTSKLVQDLEIFDIYQGDHIEKGYKSVAISLTYNAKDHTLSDDELQKAHESILESLKKKLSAEIRG